MARRSAFRAPSRDDGGELLEHGGDVVEHLYLVGIGTRASLRAQPCRLVSILLSITHGEPINAGLVRKIPVPGEARGQAKRRRPTSAPLSNREMCCASRLLVWHVDAVTAVSRRS